MSEQLIAKLKEEAQAAYESTKHLPGSAPNKASLLRIASRFSDAANELDPLTARVEELEAENDSWRSALSAVVDSANASREYCLEQLREDNRVRETALAARQTQGEKP